MTSHEFRRLHRTLGPDFLIPRDSAEKTVFVRAYWRRPTPTRRKTKVVLRRKAS